MPPTLPVIEVENPPMPEILAIEAKTGNGAEEKPVNAQAQDRAAPRARAGGTRGQRLCGKHRQAEAGAPLGAADVRDALAEQGLLVSISGILAGAALPSG